MPKTSRSILLLALLAALLLAAVNQSTAVAHTNNAQPQPYTFEPAACPFDNSELGLAAVSPEDMGFECGYVTVPERHAAPDGPTIRLPIAIMRATSPDRKPDPLFLAQGGPGGSAFDIFTFTVPGTPIANERDIVIFNQRGTQFAEPDLSCTEIFDATGELLEMSDAETAEQAYNRLLQDCYDRLAADGVDISAYNSLENAADVDAIRQALGYDSYNFYGVSYGTLLALHLMNTYPDNLRTVILDGVVPPNLNFIPEVPRTEDRILDELFAACTADPDCSRDYPDLETRYFALIDQLNNEPLNVTLTDPDTGERYSTQVDGDSLRSIIFQTFYLEDATAILPRAIAELENGRTQFLTTFWPLIEFDRTFSVGMYYSVICAEDADFAPEAIDLTGLPPAIAATAVDDLQAILDTCDLWTVDLLPASVDDAVTSEIPTLLLSGQLDPITPPAFADVAAETLPNSTVIVDPTGSHGVAFTHSCMNQIMQDFLNNPDQTPDSGCLTAEETAPFVPAGALTVPILNEFASLETSFLWQSGLAGLLLMVVLSSFLAWTIVLLVRLFSKRPWPLTPAQTRLRRIGQLLTLAFGVLAMVFVGGLVYFLFDTVVSNTAFVYVNAIPATAVAFFVIPLFLVLLALGLLVVTVLIWREQTWPLISKLYFTILTVCALGYVAILTAHGLTTAVFTQL